MQFTLPIPPSSNRYWRTIAYMDKKTRKPKAATFVSDEAKKYKRDVAKLVGAVEVIRSNVALTVRVFRPQRSGDLDNKLKVLLDALSGVIYADDKQVSTIHAYRFEDKANPRVEVEVRTLGLF